MPAGELPGAPPPADGAAIDFRLTAIVVATALFMQNLDATVLATALPTMGRDFGLPAAQMSLALTSYLLALAICIPASGPLADRLGARPIFQGAILLFVAGSVLCGFAPNLALLTAARFVQGMGGAMMMPVGRLLLLRTVPKRDMVAAMSWTLMPAMIGPILGPPVGGLIVTYLDWRWIFWLNVPMGVLGLVLVRRYIRDDGMRRAAPFDWPGFALAGLALGSLLFGFELASHAGAGAAVAVLLPLGAVAALLYLRHARRVAHPILDPSLLRIPTFRLALGAGSLVRVAQGAQPFLLPLMFQLGFGMTAAKSGSITVATALGAFGMKGVAQRILSRFGYRRSLLAFGTAAVAGYAVCGLFRPGWPFALMFALLAVAGFLASFLFTAYNTLAYDEIVPERMSAATSFYATFQQLMLSLGICAGATVLHVSAELRGAATPHFPDFTAAFFLVALAGVGAVLINRRFAADAGREMAGQNGPDE